VAARFDISEASLRRNMFEQTGALSLYLCQPAITTGKLNSGLIIVMRPSHEGMMRPLRHNMFEQTGALSLFIALEPRVE
jgi:hypothetical protein